ncbi:hypothetical protein JCM18899A_18710 [Nocardioides sp. AN3]
MAATATPPPAASRYQAISALVALQAAREALKVWGNLAQAAAALVRYQMIAATLAEKAVPLVLADQHIPSAPQARLNVVGFTTPADQFAAMAAKVDADWQRQRLIESVIQETARAAQQAALVVEPDHLGWVRHLTLPSCSRCAVLAGRIYRWSDGFQRHPGCDCTMVPVREGDARLVVDAQEMVQSGQVTDLSKADRKAVLDGADLNQVVNVRRSQAGLTEAGTVLARSGRPTPAGIYRAASSREEATALLSQHGYLR